MCRLIETIRLLDGNAENIIWHNQRFNTTRFKLFGISEEIDLNTLISIPEEFRKGEVKCRILYDENIVSIDFVNYLFRQVRSLKVVYDDCIEYNFKYQDRTEIDRLYSLKAGADDILIVKNGLVKDSSYCNFVFSDGKNFFTPSSPLLKGCKRAKYLGEGKISERDIRVEDISGFQEIHLINAFLDTGRCVVSPSDLQ